MFVSEKKFSESMREIMCELRNIKYRMQDETPVTCSCDVCEHAAVTVNSSGVCVVVCKKKMQAQCGDFTPREVMQTT